MQEHVRIKKISAFSEGLDFDALRLQGIAYLQETCGEIWTDYNEHDPGVTLLEYLSYTLTDLSYRAGFDIKDILYANEKNARESIENGFFSSVDILPTTPVTTTDYRKLLIDRIKDIRNAWFYPIENHLRGYHGLFRIRIQLADDIDRTALRTKVVEEIRTLIMAHRNLCEDLEEIIILKTEILDLAITISIEADAFGEKILANILHNLEQLLNPGIHFYTREELIAEGQAIEDIFDGPEPYHGFIKKEELRALPENTYVSTLRETISKVSGVKVVEDLKVWKEGQRITGDEILPSTDCALSINHELANCSGKNGSIRLWRNGVPVSINPLLTHQFLNTLKAKAKRDFQMKLDLSSPSVVSTKSYKDLSDYRSFQRLMPAVYGIGAEGLPATANRERRAKANQLKAYLLLFEQFMADYLVQLANVRNLFSIASEDELLLKHKEQPATYYTQFLTDVPNVHELYHHQPGETQEEIQEAILKDLQEFSSKFDPYDQRRNRFLDHLLARFGEVYNDDFLQLITNQSPEDLSHQLIQGKASFLRNYPELSSNRSKAFDYTQNAWENENISGLKKRVALLLNINEFGKSESTKKRFKYHNHLLSNSEILKGVELQAPTGTPSSKIHLPFKTVLNEGRDKDNYTVTKEKDKYHLYFQGKGAAAGAMKVEQQGPPLSTGSKEKCESDRDRLIDRFHKINAAGEGFFFLENILLRPTEQPGGILVLEYPSQNGKDNIVLRSLYYTDEKSLNDLSAEILNFAVRQDNWIILPFEDHWRLLLLKDGQPIMVSTAFDEEGLADTAKEDTKKFFEAPYTPSPSSINDYLRLESERFQGFEISHNFYSLRLSIIAPSWPALFQENDFRQLFHQVVATNVPAHLSVDYYWLELEEMATFEVLFKRWLEARVMANEKLVQQLSLELICFLRPAEEINISPPTTTDEIHQKLPEAVLRSIGATYGYAFFFPKNDFSFIHGLSAEVIEMFPDLDIDTWGELQRSDTKKMVEELLNLTDTATKEEVKISTPSEKPPVTKGDIDSWKKQVMLASNNRWTDLLRYQRRKLAAENKQWQQLEKPTKIERALQTQKRQPQKVLTGIRRWLRDLAPAESVPYPVLIFLIELTDGGIILPKDDLSIFSWIDADRQKTLNDLKINYWEDLEKIKDQTWKSITQHLDSPDLKVLKQEVDLAISGKWKALIELQQAKTINEETTAVQERMKYHLQDMQEMGVPDERLSAGWLKSRPYPKSVSAISEPVMKQLLKIMSFEHLLSSNNFQVFEGIGEKIDVTLKEVGITNWHLLAKENADHLRELLSTKLSPVTLSGMEEWINQARLASNGEWSALIESQRSPLEQEPGPTTLEKSIDRWLQVNGQAASESTTS